MNRFLKGAMLAAAVAVAMVPAGVFAEEGPYATFHIKLEANPKSSDLSPSLSEPIDKDQVAFHIVNNTGKAMYFNSTEGEYIPLVSNNTVMVPYKMGDEYKVVDSEGNTFATWNLNGYHSNQVNTASSATQEQFTAWSTSLKQVIENQKVSYQEPPAKAEPNYYETHSTRSASKTVIRGYW